MKRTIFNYFKVRIKDDGSYTNPSRTTRMYLDDLDNIVTSKCLDMLYIQNYKITHRVCNEDLNNGALNYWNQTIFKDIDYKKAINYYSKINKQIPDPKVVYDNVVNYLRNNYIDVFLYSELSRSGKGFHFIFKMNVPLTIDGYRFATYLTNKITAEAFIKCGYISYFYTPEVNDNCTDSKVQGLYLTCKDYIINGQCSGDYRNAYNKYKDDVIDYFETLRYNERPDKKIPELYHKSNISAVEDDINKKIDISFDEIIDFLGNCKISYINHTSRWMCFNEFYILLLLTNNYNEENLKKLWEKFSEIIPEENGHNYYFYKNEPYINDWNIKKENNTKQKRSLNTLKGLGITIKNILLTI